MYKQMRKNKKFQVQNSRETKKKAHVKYINK